MKITRVSTAVVEGNFPWVLVKIETDAGITGLGEAYWGVGVAELVHKAEPLIIGENPFNIGKLYDMMIRCLSGEGSLAGATVTAISGIEIALWDLVGRALNTPIYNLFGGRFRDQHPGLRRLPCRRHARARGLRGAGTRGGRRGIHRDQVRSRHANPFTADISEDLHPRRQWFEPFNRTIGTAERRWMVSVVAAVREAVGPDIMVAMDCHWKFAVNDVLKLAWDLEPYDLLWLEDPVPPENIDAQAKVTANTRVPICTGENLYRKHGYRELIEKQAADIVAPDIPKMGGLMEARKVADMADTYYINVAPHNVSSPIGTVAAAHVCASIPNFLVIEFHAHDVPWWADLVDGEPPIRDGYILLGDAPGHGMTLNEDVARAHLKPGTSFFGDTP